MSNKHLSVEHNQNFWELTSIQGASFGLSLFANGELLKSYGVASTLVSICISSLILWVLGLTIIQMTSEDRVNAIENVNAYLGKIGAGFAVLVIFLVFLTWFVLQLESMEIIIRSIMRTPEFTSFPQIVSALVGGVTTVLAIKGIQMIKSICLFTFPFLFFYTIYIMCAKGDFQSVTGSWIPTASSISLVIAIMLPGIVNIPTFFRHSRSKGDAILALSLMIIAFAIFQIFGVLTGVYSPIDLFSGSRITLIFSTQMILIAVFILTSVVCVNMVNIYFASAAWEMITSKRASGKVFAFVGTLGIIIFLVIRIPDFMKSIEVTTNNFIATLGVVLLIDFMIKIIVSHRPRAFEKGVSIFCWMVGCLVAVSVQITYPEDQAQSLMLSVSATILMFLLILFIEETSWSLKKLLSSEQR